MIVGGVSGFIVGVGGLIVRVCFFLFTFDDVAMTLFG